MPAGNRQQIAASRHRAPHQRRLDVGWVDGERTRRWVYGKTERECCRSSTTLNVESSEARTLRQRRARFKRGAKNGFR
jgi:hypothetical protein